MWDRIRTVVLTVCFALLLSVTIAAMYSKIVDKPIVYESAKIALYDGMVYRQYGIGRGTIGETLVYCKIYISIIDSKAIVIFKAEKERPIFCMVYTPGPNQAKDGRGWIDDNCDGNFHKLNIADKAKIPECYRRD